MEHSDQRMEDDEEVMVKENEKMENEKMKKVFEEIGIDLLGNILNYLTWEEKAKLRAVSKFFKYTIEKAERKIIWKGLSKKHGKETIRYATTFENIHEIALNHCQRLVNDEEFNKLVEKNRESLIKMRAQDAGIIDVKLQNMRKLECVEFERCRKLQTIKINETKIRVWKMTSTKICGLDFEAIQKAIHNTVEYMDVSGSQNLKSVVTKEIYPYKQLSYLNISRTKIYDELIPILLKAAPQLETLIVTYSELSGPRIENHSHLKYLSMKNGRFLYDGPLIVNCPALREVDFSRTPISKNAIERLFKTHPNITKIDLSETYHLNDDRMELIVRDHQGIPETGIKYRSKLQDINLSMTLTNDALIEELMHYHPQLNKINLKSTRISNCKLSSSKLQWADLSENMITNETIETLIKNCENLAYLNIAGCSQINSSIEIVSSSLSFLSLQSTKLSREAIENILKNTPNLEFLNIRGCDVFKEIELSHTNLRELNISCCSQMTTFTLATPSLETLECNNLINLQTINIKGQKPSIRHLLCTPNPSTSLHVIYETFPNPENSRLLKPLSQNLTKEDLMKSYKSTVSIWRLKTMFEKAMELQELEFAGQVACRICYYYSLYSGTESIADPNFSNFRLDEGITFGEKALSLWLPIHGSSNFHQGIQWTLQNLIHLYEIRKNHLIPSSPSGNTPPSSPSKKYSHENIKDAIHTKINHFQQLLFEMNNSASTYTSASSTTNNVKNNKEREENTNNDKMEDDETIDQGPKMVDEDAKVHYRSIVPTFSVSK